ncbi:MAG: hypothetical protein R3338_07490 [Thermoanaerobaculia bacterium]|nr:hypothetical protein [Thermoanaerobaculia bacterium]
MADLNVEDLFFDTSVLLTGMIDFGRQSESALILMDLVAGGDDKPMTAWHCCLEFFSIATRLPEEYRLTTADATLILLEEILGRFSIRDLPTRSRRSFVDTLPRDSISGGQIFDAHIAEIARHSGAGAIVTENRRDFVTLLRHGIPVINTQEVMERLNWA